MDDLLRVGRVWKQHSMLERVIRDIGGALEHSLFAEEISSRRGLLQGLDARVKIVCTIALLIGVNLSHRLAVIGAVYLLAAVLAWRSRIPAAIFIRRVWLLLPLFTGAIILPALFMTPGPALIALPWGLIVTRTGLMTGLFLVMRVSVSVSLTLLLVLTTRWNTVLSALCVMRVPDVFILTLGMTYRYIYLLLHLANDMFLSRKSRVVGRLSASEQRHIMAAATTTLLNKSLAMSGEVYLAMKSRGFTGRVVTFRPFAMQGRDWFWGGLLLSMAMAAIVFGR
jgi:cobalt ECF transporter T component CbiQ